MPSPSKDTAALKIQRFWQKRQGYAQLAGSYNYSYYLSLLELSDQHDPFTKLAKMMYGRVIATPETGFSFLMGPNPYLGRDPCYHRNDILGSKLTSIICKQWGIKEDIDYIYIPVVDTKLGTIDDAIRAVGGINGGYQLITPPDTIPNKQHLKFIKITKNQTNPRDDLFYTANNRWGKLASLGIIASPWVLAQSAIDSGFKPENEVPCSSQSVPLLIKQSLERQPKTIEQLKKCDLIKKLNRLKKSNSDASLLAKGLYSIIDGLPLDIEAPDIIARLSFFLEIALLMHHDDHARLADVVSVIIHELSLLVLKYGAVQKKPLIDIDEYQTITATEMNHWINVPNSDYQFIALPAHSGSHANFIASKLAQNIHPKENGESHTVHRVGGEYWEIMNESRQYTVFGRLVTHHHADIVRLSAGPIGDYSKGTYPAIDINKLLRQKAATNASLKTLIIDITSASFSHLKLAPDVLKIIEERKISLIFWESGQKFGLLHTDQAQYGRVFAYYPKENVSPAYIKSLKESAASDMHVPDVQIGAFIGKNAYPIMQQIREKHFKNGAILRQILAEDNYRGINTNHSYELSVDEQQDPFLYNGHDFCTQEIKKIKLFFKRMNRDRCSFGHRYTTQEGGYRIAAGAEHTIATTVFALGLRHYIQLSPTEINEKIMKHSETVDIFNKKSLINYLGLLKAWEACPESTMTITLIIANRLRALITNSAVIKGNVLDGSDQFLTDVYTLLRSKSPFKKMIQEATYRKDSFAITLFEIFHDTFIKTGNIDIDNSIKKALRQIDNIPLGQPINEKIILIHKQKLISGEYSKSAFSFFIKKNEPTFNNNNNNPPTSVGMQVLAGFIAVVGITAVAVAFTLLHAATFGTVGLIIAGIGIATILTGSGLFALNKRTDSNALINSNAHVPLTSPS